MHLKFQIKGDRHGNRPVMLSWSPRDDILAVAARTQVTFYTKDGALVDKIPTENSTILDVMWSPNGAYFAVLCSGSQLVRIWSSSQKSLIKLMLDVTDPTCLSWNTLERQLVIGTGQGHIFTYDPHTTKRVPQMTKHVRRLVSVCHTISTHRIISLSAESLIVSDSDGNTQATLKQKALGCLFLGRLLPIEILIDTNECIDAVAVPAFFHPSITKKSHSDSQVSYEPGYKLIIISTVPEMWSAETLDSKNLFTAVVNGIDGCAILNLPDVGADTLIDMVYCPRTASIPPSIFVLFSNALILRVSLDRSKVGFNLSTDAHVTRFGAIMWQRNAIKLSVSGSTGTYNGYIEEMNDQVGLQDNANGINSLTEYIMKGVSTCHGIGFLSVLGTGDKLVLPVERGFSVVNLHNPTQETPYLLFGKNPTFPGITGYPVNISHSLFNRGLCAVAFSNGVVTVMLTTNVVLWQVSVPLNPPDVCYLDQSVSEASVFDHKKGVVFCLSLASPSVASLSFVLANPMAPPKAYKLSTLIDLNGEPSQFAVSDGAIGYLSNSKIRYSKLILIGSDPAQLNPELSWHTAEPTTKPTRFDIMTLETGSICIVSLAQEGTLEVIVGSCPSLILSDVESLKFQVCVCCSPFIYGITFGGMLVVYSIYEDDGKLNFVKVAAQQLPDEFTDNVVLRRGTDANVTIKLSPGGTICAIYRTGAKIRPCFYLPAEGILINDARYSRILSEEASNDSFESVSLLFKEEPECIYDITFDSLLANTFVITTCTKIGSDCLPANSYVCVLHHSLPEQEGYGILAVKASVATSSSTTLPTIVAGGMGFVLDGAELRQRDYISGLQSFATCLAFYDNSASFGVPRPLLLKGDDIEDNTSQKDDLFMSYYSYLAPLQDSLLQYTGQEFNSVPFKISGLFPKYRSLKAAGLLQEYEKAAVELGTIGHTKLAFILASVSGNTDVMKYVADSAVRITDFSTALTAYRELSLYGTTEEHVMHSLGTYQDTTFLDSRGAQCVNDLLRNLSTMNTTHSNDPAALSLFLSRICINEYDNNTAMALSLLMACPDLPASGDNSSNVAFAMGQSKADVYLSAAERFLLKSRKPNVALSFRMDSLDWNTASMLATRIGSTAVRSEILIQWAGELENRLQYPECLDVCMNLLKDDSKQGQESGEARFMWSSIPPKLIPFLIGLMSRCYAQLGKLSDLKEMALPPRKEATNRFVPRVKDPLNILQRSRLCMECGNILCLQKRFAEAALFLEASSNLAEACYSRLRKEIAGLLSGELNIYAYIYNSTDTNMIRVGGNRGGGSGIQGTGGTKPLLLFALIPSLLTTIANSALSQTASGDSSGIDISIVKEIDAVLNVEATKKLLSELLPTSIQDIVQEKDLKEIDPPLLLSRAVGCYIKSRQYGEAERLIDNVTDMNIVADLARVYMKDDPDKALVLFKRAGQSREIVDCLIALGKISEAESAVKETKLLLEKAHAGERTTLAVYELEAELKGSSASLSLYHRTAGNIKKAIFFGVLSGAFDEAFDLAIQTSNEDILIRLVNERAPQEFLKKAVRYFSAPVTRSNPDISPLDETPETSSQPLQVPRNIRAAAHFLELLGEHEAAIKLLLHYGDGSTDIDKALDLLKSCKQSVSIIELILKYLNGELDGCKRPPLYVFKFYMAMEKYGDAARTAYLLADREIEAGRYSKAKSVLIQCACKLRMQAKHMPTKFRDLLILLHGLEAGKVFSKAGLHAQAAMCLYRTSRLASRFGDAAVNVLLPATVECSRAGPRYANEAYECACILLKEYGDKIPEKYKKPVEQVVRKHKKGEPVDAEYRSCCSCGENVLLGSLSCENCMAVLPLDSATGAQITLADYCECPTCLWTCSKLGFYDVYKEEEIRNGQCVCLMCGAKINIEQPVIITEDTFERMTNGFPDLDEYSVKPLLIYENGQLAQRRYEQWTRLWQDQEN